MRVKPLPSESNDNFVFEKKYLFPEFLSEIVAEKDYRKWLSRKALTHHRRDRKRCIATAPIELYRLGIRRAVLTSEGRDFYTSELLEWRLLSKYRNEQSKHGRKTYKKAFALLPTVDHVGEAEGRPHFVICGWRTNDSKSDLTYREFTLMCTRVLETAKDRKELIDQQS
jgi:hypothetical protein